MNHRIHRAYIERQRLGHATQARFEIVTRLPKMNPRASCAERAIQIEIVEIEVNVGGGVLLVIQADVEIVAPTVTRQAEGPAEDAIVTAHDRHRRVVAELDRQLAEK